MTKDVKVDKRNTEDRMTSARFFRSTDFVLIKENQSTQNALRLKVYVYICDLSVSFILFYHLTPVLAQDRNHNLQNERKCSVVERAWKL